MLEQTAANLIAFIVNQLHNFKKAKSFDLQDTVLPRIDAAITMMNFTWFIRFELGSLVISSFMTFFCNPSDSSSQSSQWSWIGQCFLGKRKKSIHWLYSYRKPWRVGPRSGKPRIGNLWFCVLLRFTSLCLRLWLWFWFINESQAFGRAPEGLQLFSIVVQFSQWENETCYWKNLSEWEWWWWLPLRGLAKGLWL